MTDGARSARADAIDVARAFALLGMVVYHSTWDLADFGFIGAAAPFSPAMRAFSHAVAGAFLALVGVSLALAHRNGMHWDAFARRLARIVAAAALVTAATLITSPAAPIGFGILHCIAAASLIAAAFLYVPVGVAFVVGVAAIAAPRIWTSDAFDSPALIWVGLGQREPSTLDWRPLLPWAGVVWISLDVTRALMPRLIASPLMAWRANLTPVRGLAFFGRHSLAFYLLHQPALFACLFALSQILGLSASREREAYLATCRPACVNAGGAPEACARACECVAARAINAGLIASLTSRFVSEADREKLGGAVQACSTEAQ